MARETGHHSNGKLASRGSTVFGKCLERNCTSHINVIEDMHFVHKLWEKNCIATGKVSTHRKNASILYKHTSVWIWENSKSEVKCIFCFVTFKTAHAPLPWHNYVWLMEVVLMKRLQRWIRKKTRKTLTNLPSFLSTVFRRLFYVRRSSTHWTIYSGNWLVGVGMVELHTLISLATNPQRNCRKLTAETWGLLPTSACCWNAIPKSV